MAWRMNVRMYESCSCKMVCRCTLGPAEPDQGWCSGAIGVEVLDGESEGVELTGAKLVLLAELPGDFLGGIDKAKLYLDSSRLTFSVRNSTPSSMARGVGYGQP